MRGKGHANNKKAWIILVSCPIGLTAVFEYRNSEVFD
jgi:hypothetical protein